MSAPVDPVASLNSLTVGTPASAKGTPHQRPSFPPGSFSQYGSYYQQGNSTGPTQPMQAQDQQGSASTTTTASSHSPMFTTALSGDLQTFLGPNFDINNATMTMDNSQDPSTYKFWDFTSPEASQIDYAKNMFDYPGLTGLTSTLAPSAPENFQTNMDEYNMKPYMSGPGEFSSLDGTPGQLTPGNFDSFIDWDQEQS
jgi:hypothetical protein